MTVRLDQPRWWVNVVHFQDGNIKIRISAITANGIVTIANVNAVRLDDLIDILSRVKAKLNQLGVKTKEERSQGDII